MFGFSSTRRSAIASDLATCRLQDQGLGEVAGKQDTLTDWSGHSTAGHADLSLHACYRNQALLLTDGV
jgi:hypothetical protein